MSEAMRVDPPVSISEFDAFLNAQNDDSLWELVAGRILAMTNPTEAHGAIGANRPIFVPPPNTGGRSCGAGADGRNDQERVRHADCIG